MAYFTKDEAREAARSAVSKSYRSNSRAILGSLAQSASTTESFDIFLSHSSKDAELVLGVKTLLERQGLKVYVDWHDDPQASRDDVTEETADLLRKRMKQSKSLIFMASENSSGSKWMPWELGYFDGFTNGRVAVLPLVDYSSSSFKGQEYLGLYPVVDKGYYKNTLQQETFVKKRSGWSTLGQFGRGEPTWNSYSL
jgi:hypothetical protein